MFDYSQNTLSYSRENNCSILVSQYYQSENERLAALNKRLDDGGHQLQEEAATAQKRLFHVKVDYTIEYNACSSVILVILFTST